ncbi:cardiolipin synthase [Lonepinella koalarum]|uniref:Cardiolipin synthase n=1 Tax=Lonepinella koalarum TaxID=53417 RepID=A0A4R1KYK0_9PAST|nr:cardiolipin synthase [Lonepinella koalarum]MDH2926755.1 cardiolipin synthase [Lonepinella koalarum]TCK70585.1 cardiolipin synthase [Lonepinella koalarum]TFJ90033.1 cardiolipin synthase [Lonepinella koalarum]TYG33874.1 cardiolipin synthase [Lonepinella koalarum]
MDFTLIGTILYFSLTLVYAIRILYKQRNSGSALAWLFLIFGFPVGGIALYSLLGEPRLGNQRAKRNAELQGLYQQFDAHFPKNQFWHRKQDLPLTYQGISQAAATDGGFDVTNGNDLTLLSTTDEILTAMLADIQAAEHSCLLAFYIIEPTGRIETLLNTLLEATKRGVDVVILADAVGSSRFFRSHYPKILAAAGVRVQAMLPVGLLKSFFVRSDLRNHRKIMIVDQKIAYTGSFNLVDPKHFKQHSGVGEWIDVMMRCRGVVVLELTAVFFSDFYLENDLPTVDIEQQLQQLAHQTVPKLNDYHTHDNALVQVVPSSPEQRDKVIYQCILAALYQAKHKIIITTPYFVPDDNLLTALINAAKRGIDITLILPKKSDSRLVHYASRAHYPALLAAGVKIALFQDGLLHAKLLSIDDDFTLFGTVNMDLRSMFLNLEISLAIYDHNTSQTVQVLQQYYLNHSQWVNNDKWQRRSSWWGVVENAVRLVSPLL